MPPKFTLYHSRSNPANKIASFDEDFDRVKEIERVETISYFLRAVRWRSSISCYGYGSGRVKSHGNYAQGFKQQQISGGSTIDTDCFRVYLCLEKVGYHHEAVNQSVDEWVRGETYTNSCENRAFLFKPWLAIHRGVCKDNLSLYLAAFKACRKSWE